LVNVVFCFGQELKLIETYTENSAPNVGAAPSSTEKRESKLKSTYKIDFRFTKVNSVSEGKCVFNFSDGNDLFTAELSEGDIFPYEIFNADKTISVEVKFVKLLLNKESPIASLAQLEYKVFRKTKK